MGARKPLVRSGAKNTQLSSGDVLDLTSALTGIAATAGLYNKLARVTVTAAPDDAIVYGSLVYRRRSSGAATGADQIDVLMRVRSTAIGTPPTIQLVYNNDVIELGYVIIQSTPTIIVDLYVRTAVASVSAQFVEINRHISDTTNVDWLSNQSYLSGTPSGYFGFPAVKPYTTAYHPLADALSVPRKINGVPFDGTQDITLNNASFSIFEFIATAGQTVFSGTDRNGAVLAANPGNSAVNLSGSTLSPGLEYTLTATTCTLAAATVPVSAGDLLQIVVFNSFSVANTYTKAEVDAIALNAGEPLMSVEWWPNRASIPAGYVAADGQTYLRSVYPTAFNALANMPQVTDAVWLSDPTKRGCYTLGDGSTTFRVPDYNGKSSGSLGAMFLRGDGAGSSGTDGTMQADDLKAHSHTINIGALTPGGANNQSYTAPYRFVMARTDGTAFADGVTTAIASTGGTETRPMNVTGCWVIKLFGVLNNPGLVDVAALAAIIATYKSAAKADILGTVSQSGGVPTGAIFEKGSNANGTWIKFADGTVICCQTVTPVVANASNISFTWTFPVALVQYLAGSISVGGTLGTAKAINGQGFYSRSNLYGVAYIFSPGSYVAADITNYGVLFDMFVIGRWY